MRVSRSGCGFKWCRRRRSWKRMRGLHHRRSVDDSRRAGNLRCGRDWRNRSDRRGRRRNHRLCRNWRRGRGRLSSDGRRGWSWRRNFGRSGNRCGRCGTSRGLRKHRVRRKAHTPESRSRFRKTKFNIADRVAVGLGFHHLADNFFFRFFVGQENQLAGSKLSRDANHRSVSEHQNGRRLFGKRFALVGAFHRAGSVHANRNFQRDRLRASRSFGGRFWSGSCWRCRCGGDSGIFRVFYIQCHRPLTQAELGHMGRRTGFPSCTSICSRWAEGSHIVRKYHRGPAVREE